MRVVDTLDMNGNIITGVAAPVGDNDAATKLYVSQQVAAAGGMDTEGVQDIISTTVIGTSTISFTYDDVNGTFTANVLDSPKLGGATLTQVRDFSQTTGTRTSSAISDFATAAVAAANAGVIDADTLAGSTKAQVIADAIAGVVDTAPTTLDTLNELAAALGDDANFATTVNTALAARVRSVGATIGDGVATSYTVTHNLGTRDVTVALYEAAGTYEEAWATVRRPTINTVTVDFGTAPTTGQWRVVVQGRPD